MILYHIGDNNKSYFDDANSRCWKIGASGAGNNHGVTWGTAQPHRMTILANNLTCADHLSAIQTTGEYTLDTEINDMQPGIYFATISLKNSSEEFLKTIRLVKGK